MVVPFVSGLVIGVVGSWGSFQGTALAASIADPQSCIDQSLNVPFFVP